MIQVPTGIGNTITTAAYSASTTAVTAGWFSVVMNWNWGTISFMVGILAAVFTAGINAWYKRKTYALMERSVREGKVYYEYKE